MSLRAMPTRLLNYMFMMTETYNLLTKHGTQESPISFIGAWTGKLTKTVVAYFVGCALPTIPFFQNNSSNGMAKLRPKLLSST